MIDQNLNLVNSTLSEREPHESILNQTLVDKVFDSIPPSVDHNFTIESELHTTHVLLVSLDSNELGGSPPNPMAQGGNHPIPTTQGVISPVPTTPAPSSMVTSSD